jgi:phage FluMu protein Com
MIDVRCKGCNRFLAKATIMVAAIKCPRCKGIYEYHIYTNTLHINNSYDIIPKETIESTLHNGATTSVID